MSDDTWHDITTICSLYEEQINDQGRFRHRPLRLGEIQWFEERGYGEWTYGRPAK